MPIIKSAKKKVKQDKKRASRNRKVVKEMKTQIKLARKSPNETAVKSAHSAIDTASKKNIIHKNKAARLKSSVAKNAKQKTVKKMRSVAKSSKK